MNDKNLRNEDYYDCPKCGDSIFRDEYICPSCGWKVIPDENKYGYLRQDSDSHWYLIPEGMEKNFSSMIDQIETEHDWEKKEFLIDLFIEAFDTYRLSGGIQDLKILIP